MDYTALNEAYKALPASEQTPLATALAALQAQTTTLTGQPIAVPSMFAVLEGSTAGDWAKVVLRSRGTPSGVSPPTAADQAISAAIEAVALFQAGGAVTAQEWPLCSSWLNALEAVGDVSSASVTAITALSTVTVPTFPGLEMGDLQTAGV